MIITRRNAPIRSLLCATPCTALPNAARSHRVCREQRELAVRVSQQDDADWLAQGTDQDMLAGLRLVGGLDISFFPPTADIQPGSSSGGGRGGADAVDASASPVAQPPSGARASSAAGILAAGDSEAGTAAAVPASGLEAAAAAGDRAVAALAVLSFPPLQLLHLEMLELTLSVPYLPGLLGFR